MKIPVDFPANFDSDEMSPIQLGRLYLGTHVVRIGFCPDGKLRLNIPQAALDAGLVQITPTVTEQPLTGFGAAPTAS